MICFDASNNGNFGDIVPKLVANEPPVQSPLDKWFSLMPSDLLTFLGYELFKYLPGHTVSK